MREYDNIVSEVLRGVPEKNERTGISTFRAFNVNFCVDLKNGFPLLTTKRVNWDAVKAELFWFLSGDNHIRELKKKTSIWNNWADENGGLDTAYGFYWRKFPSTGKAMVGVDHAGNISHVDQVKYVIELLKKDKSSRRAVISAWDPGNATVSKLPPCHILQCYNIVNDKLNLHVTQRSADVALGVPFNIASYALLNTLMAHCIGCRVGKLAITFVDCHIYSGINPGDEYDHIPGLNVQMGRIPRPLPTLSLLSDTPTDINAITENDVILSDYFPYEPIQFKVAV